MWNLLKLTVGFALFDELSMEKWNVVANLRSMKGSDEAPLKVEPSHEVGGPDAMPPSRCRRAPENVSDCRERKPDEVEALITYLCNKTLFPVHEKGMVTAQYGDIVQSRKQLRVCFCCSSIYVRVHMYRLCSGYTASMLQNLPRRGTKIQLWRLSGYINSCLTALGSVRVRYGSSHHCCLLSARYIGFVGSQPQR